ncbi:cytidine deaminase [bacterium]|nr:MAG: cytidine deaminase [bacterium]
MINPQGLLNKAHEAQKNAYSPYSNFQVGAALQTKDGSIYTGCNIENASYGAAICAERVAFVKAVSDGHKNFKAIAIAGSHNKHTYPCGICRQFMAEFGLNLVVITTDMHTIAQQVLSDLLPKAFTSFQPNQDNLVKMNSCAQSR